MYELRSLAQSQIVLWAVSLSIDPMPFDERPAAKLLKDLRISAQLQQPCNFQDGLRFRPAGSRHRESVKIQRTVQKPLGRVPTLSTTVCDYEKHRCHFENSLFVPIALVL